MLSCYQYEHTKYRLVLVWFLLSSVFWLFHHLAFVLHDMIVLTSGMNDNLRFVSLIKGVWKRKEMIILSHFDVTCQQYRSPIRSIISSVSECDKMMFKIFDAHFIHSIRMALTSTLELVQIIDWIDHETKLKKNEKIF